MRDHPKVEADWAEIRREVDSLLAKSLQSSSFLFPSFAWFMGENGLFLGLNPKYSNANKILFDV